MRKAAEKCRCLSTTVRLGVMLSVFGKNAADQKAVTPPHFTVPDTKTVTALQKLFDR